MRKEIMKTSIIAIFVMSVTTALVAAETVNFDDMKTGAAPPGWTATQTGKGSGKWSVEKDESAPSKPNVLKQSGQARFRFASRMTPTSRMVLLK
jgi:hypothetical protein